MTTSTTPLVSVVMPLRFPDERFFPAAVRSILEQTLTNIELIIVEDPSPRSGRSMLGELANDPRLRYIENDYPTGLPQQHNRAVSEARGELIARFDADDLSEPHRLARQAELMTQHADVGVIASFIQIIDESDREVGVRTYPTEHAAIVRAMHRYNPISGSNAMFRRRVVDAVGGWREDSELPAQDYEWYSRVARAGFRFAIVPEPLIRYRIHPSQIKSTKLRGTLRTTLEVKRRYWYSEMNLLSKIRMRLEMLLLLAPPSLVAWLFRTMHYRRTGRTHRAKLSIC
ncbi:MAG: glycosyltransferase [Acidobacteriota bacterium]|nr:glycosyltransferase [Acidobacteriota bacterium]